MATRPRRCRTVPILNRAGPTADLVSEMSCMVPRKTRFRHALLIGSAFLLGVVAAPTVNVLGSALAQDSGRADIFQMLKVFGDVVERVRADYVEPVNDRQLI